MLSPVLSHSSHVISVNISLQSQYIPPPSILWYIFKVQQYRITPKEETGVCVLYVTEHVTHINECRPGTGSKLTGIVTSPSCGRDPKPTLSVSGAI